MANTDNSLGLVYISEMTTPEGAEIKNLNVKNAAGVPYVEFDACLQSFDVMNRNKRYYVGSNLAEMLRAEKIQSQLADNGWFGEMDHPAPNVEGEKLTPERVRRIEMSRRSHKIMNPRVEGNLLNARIQTSSGTEWGRGMANDIIQGMIPRFSCRAIAAMEYANGRPTVNVKQLITYDWVLYPSHKEAGMVGAAHQKFAALTEGAVITPVDGNGDQCIALIELMKYAGQHDPSTSMICESFGLDEEAIIGFTKDYKHGIVLDGTNTIYTNMSPDVVSRVKNSLCDLF